MMVIGSPIQMNVLVFPPQAFFPEMALKRKLKVASARKAIPIINKIMVLVNNKCASMLNHLHKESLEQMS